MPQRFNSTAAPVMGLLVVTTLLLCSAMPIHATTRELLAPAPSLGRMACTGWGFGNDTITPCNTLKSKTACESASLGPLGAACTWSVADPCCTGTPTECASVPKGSLLSCLMLNGCWINGAGECVGKPDSCSYQPPLPQFVEGSSLKMTANKHCRAAGCKFTC